MFLITCRDDKPPNLSYCEHGLVVGSNSGFFQQSWKPEITVYVMPWLMNLRIKLCTYISAAGCTVRRWPFDDVFSSFVLWRELHFLTEVWYPLCSSKRRTAPWASGGSGPVTWEIWCVFTLKRVDAYGEIHTLRLHLDTSAPLLFERYSCSRNNTPQAAEVHLGWKILRTAMHQLYKSFIPHALPINHWRRHPTKRNLPTPSNAWPPNCARGHPIFRAAR